MNEGNINMPPVGKAVEKNEIIVGDLFFYNHQHLVVTEEDENLITLKQQPNVHDRDETYELKITRHDLGLIKSLGEIYGKNARGGETYAPANGDVILAALDHLTREIENKKLLSSDYVDTLSYEIMELGDRDSELIVIINTETKMNKGRGPATGYEDAVFLSVNYLKFGFPKKLSDILENLRERAFSQGNESFSVHFTGRVYEEPQEKPVQTYV